MTASWRNLLIIFGLVYIGTANVPAQTKTSETESNTQREGTIAFHSGPMVVKATEPTRPAYRLTPLDKQNALSLVRDLLEGKEPKEATLSVGVLDQLCNYPVFITLYSKSGTRLRAWQRSPSSTGRELLRAAAKRIAKSAAFHKPSFNDPKAYRIKIDFTLGMFVVPINEARKGNIPFAPGVTGLCFRYGKKNAWLLPADAIERHLDTKKKAVVYLLKKIGMTLDDFKSKSIVIMSFLTSSFIENATHTGYVDLFRASVLKSQLSAEELLEAAKAGGRWLARSQKDNGAYYYKYYAVQNKYDPDESNRVRHAGTTYAMFRLYGVTRDEAILQSAEKAMRFLQSVIHDLDDERAYVLQEPRASLGGSALALLAISERRAVTGDNSLDDLAAKLANFIISLQREDGSFVMGMDPKTQQPSERPSRYYPGESLLALMRAYEVYRQSKYLAAAAKAADYLVLCRDTAQQRREPWQDQWLMMGLDILYKYRPLRRYANYCFITAETMIRHQYRPFMCPARDYLGGQDNCDPPRTTPTATNTEGMIGAYRLAKRIGAPRQNYLNSILLGVKFQLENQYTEDNTYYLPAPERAIGGFRGSPISEVVRNDYVQHNVCSLLGAAEILKEETSEQAGIVFLPN